MWTKYVPFRSACPLAGTIYPRDRKWLLIKHMQGAHSGSQSATLPCPLWSLPKALLHPSSPLYTFFSLFPLLLWLRLLLQPLTWSHFSLGLTLMGDFMHPRLQPQISLFTLPWAPDPAWRSVSHLTFDMSPPPHLLFLFRLYFSKFLHQPTCDTPGSPSPIPHSLPASSLRRLYLLKVPEGMNEWMDGWVDRRTDG